MRGREKGCEAYPGVLGMRVDEEETEKERGAPSGKERVTEGHGEVVDVQWLV